MGCAASTHAARVSGAGKTKKLTLTEGSRLDLAELDLSTLPAEIDSLAAKVEDLCLEKNSLVDTTDTPQFTALLAKFVRLRHLNMESNRLTSAPKAIFALVRQRARARSSSRATRA